jgi:hypothetical protein
MCPVPRDRASEVPGSSSPIPGLATSGDPVHHLALAFDVVLLDVGRALRWAIFLDTPDTYPDVWKPGPRIPDLGNCFGPCRLILRF